MDETIVMYDSQEAAQYLTGIWGWVDRHGIYYGYGPEAELTARYAGCTHKPCAKCGQPTEKMYASCNACRRLAEIARYGAMPRAGWDGKAMVYSEARGEFFDSPDDAAEAIDEDETLADLRLVICEPVYVTPLESDYCSDDLPEDGELPDAVWEAMQAFNAAVAGIVLSWAPGKYALDPGVESLE